MTKFDKLIVDSEFFLQNFTEDASFNRYFYKIKTLQLNLVNCSQYGNGCDFKFEIIKHQSNYCFIPTRSYCFIEFINYSSGGDYKQQYPDLIRKKDDLIF